MPKPRRDVSNQDPSDVGAERGADQGAPPTEPPPPGGAAAPLVVDAPSPLRRRRAFVPTHAIGFEGETLHVRPDHNGLGGLDYFTADGWLTGDASGWSTDHEGRLCLQGAPVEAATIAKL